MVKTINEDVSSPTPVGTDANYQKAKTIGVSNAENITDERADSNSVSRSIFHRQRIAGIFKRQKRKDKTVSYEMSLVLKPSDAPLRRSPMSTGEDHWQDLIKKSMDYLHQEPAQDYYENMQSQSK
jgi:hypothetical protein